MEIWCSWINVVYCFGLYLLKLGMIKVVLELKLSIRFFWVRLKLMEDISKIWLLLFMFNNCEY